MSAMESSLLDCANIPVVTACLVMGPNMSALIEAVLKNLLMQHVIGCNRYVICNNNRYVVTDM